MSKHTPGPWRVVEHSWSDTGIYSDKHHIAHLSIEGVATERNQSELEASMGANAKLIAAAPDLLEALVHIKEYWNGGRSEQAMSDALYHILEIASVGIDKATK